MNKFSEERKIRAAFPVIRWIQTYLPLSVAHWLLKQGKARAKPGYAANLEPVSADGVDCIWVLPPGRLSENVLLYLHGGGFVYGLTPPHLQMGAYLAHKTGARILMVEYRVAPRHPFPAALDDCVAAYRWLLSRNFPARNIAVAGDSAGGNLTLTSLLKLRNEGTPLPASAVCLSPVTDLTHHDRSRPGFQDPILPDRVIQFYNRSYLAGQAPQNPLISPVLGDLTGLPPLLIHAGEEEILREDAERIAAVAKSAGVDVRLEIYPRMWHVWQLILSLPQATQSLEDIAGFLTGHWSRVSP